MIWVQRAAAFGCVVFAFFSATIVQVGLDLQGGLMLDFVVTEQASDDDMRRTAAALRQRLRDMEVSGHAQVHGQRQITVSVSGGLSAQEQQAIIGTPEELVFRTDDEVVLEGESVDQVQIMLNDYGLPHLKVTLTPEAAIRFGAWTGAHVGEQLRIELGDEVLLDAVIQDAIEGGVLQIEMGAADAEPKTSAADLAMRMRAATLPVPIELTTITEVDAAGSSWFGMGMVRGLAWLGFLLSLVHLGLRSPWTAIPVVLTTGGTLTWVALWMLDGTATVPAILGGLAAGLVAATLPLVSGSRGNRPSSGWPSLLVVASCFVGAVGAWPMVHGPPAGFLVAFIPGLLGAGALAVVLVATTVNIPKP